MSEKYDYDWKKYRAKKYGVSVKDLNVDVVERVEGSTALVYKTFVEHLDLLLTIKSLNHPMLSTREDIIKNLKTVILNLKMGLVQEGLHQPQTVFTRPKPELTEHPYYDFAVRVLKLLKPNLSNEALKEDANQKFIEATLEDIDREAPTLPNFNSALSKEEYFLLKRKYHRKNHSKDAITAIKRKLPATGSSLARKYCDKFNNKDLSLFGCLIDLWLEMLCKDETLRDFNVSPNLLVDELEREFLKANLDFYIGEIVKYQEEGYDNYYIDNWKNNLSKKDIEEFTDSEVFSVVISSPDYITKEFFDKYGKDHPKILRVTRIESEEYKKRRLELEAMEKQNAE